MADFNANYSDIVADAPVDVLPPIYKQERAGNLTEMDNVGGGSVGNREIPALPRSEP